MGVSVNNITMHTSSDGAAVSELEEINIYKFQYGIYKKLGLWRKEINKLHHSASIQSLLASHETELYDKNYTQNYY